MDQGYLNWLWTARTYDSDWELIKIANSQNEAEKDKAASSSSQKPKANRFKNPKRKSVVEIPSESEDEENKQRRLERIPQRIKILHGK